MRNPLEDVIKIKGGQVALAEAINVKQGHIWSWLNKTKLGAPGEYVIGISHSVDWKVTPHELRPDLYPHPNDGLPENMRGQCADAEQAILTVPSEIAKLNQAIPL